MENIIKKADSNILHTYNRYPVVLEKGDGVYLYDTEGKKYLDFMSGIGVCSLGYGDKEYSEALKKQVDMLLHTSNMFYTNELAEAAKVLCEGTGMDKVFFTNSGTEANEGALKLARKYAIKKGHENRTEYISMEQSFHGRSMGSVSITGTSKYREPFEPLISGVSFGTFNNLESVKALLNENTCGIILEPVQGEGGIHVATPEFMKGIRELCDEHDILMICDEVQCGMGRTGTLFSYEPYGIRPDVVTLAKGIGAGVPVGAFAVTDQCSCGLEPGDHGTTFGGNPFVSTAVVTVMDIFKKRNIVKHVAEMGKYLSEQLTQLAKEKDTIVECRGIGLMQGIECNILVAPIIQQALKEGVIFISAGPNVIRLLPPLVIEKEHIDHMMEKLRDLL